MLYILSIILVSFGGVLTDSCWKREKDCEKGLDFDFPKNEEELENSCQIIRDVATCILHVKENCKEHELEEEKQENEKIVQAFKKLLEFLDEFCDTDNSMFQVISSNVECAYPVIKAADRTCPSSKFREQRQDAVKDYEQIIKRNESIYLTNCLNELWHIACAATLVSEKCGSEVFLTLTEVLTGLSYQVQMYCDQDIADEIQLFMLAIALSENDAEKSDEEIRKKK